MLRLLAAALFLVSTMAAASHAGVPSTPLPFTVQRAPAPGALDLSWAAPWDDGGSPILEYRLLEFPRGTLADPFLVAAYPATARSARIEGLRDSSEYCYALTAVNAHGESYRTNRWDACAMTARPPGRPQGFRVEPAGVGISMPGEAILRWDPPLDDGGLPVTGYVLARDDAYEWRGLRIIEVLDGNQRHHVDTGLRPGQTHKYLIYAVNEVGFQGYPFHGQEYAMACGASGPAPALPPEAGCLAFVERFTVAAGGAPSPTPAPELVHAEGAGSGRVQVGWSHPAQTSPANPVERYLVERITPGVSWWTQWALPATATEFVDEDAPDGLLLYRVAAKYRTGQEARSALDVAKSERAPSAPRDLVARLGASIGAGTWLEWSPPADFGEGVSYVLYNVHARDAASRGPWTRMLTTSGTFMSIGADVDASRLRFYVTAEGYGESAPSNLASGLPA